MFWFYFFSNIRLLYLILFIVKSEGLKGNWKNPTVKVLYVNYRVVPTKGYKVEFQNVTKPNIVIIELMITLSQKPKKL